jgi:hypothetical protein
MNATRIRAARGDWGAEESAELKKAAAGGWGFSDEKRFQLQVTGASQTSVGCRRTPGRRASRP